MNQTNDYRSYLANVYRRRANANPNYSLRAFARDLGISPGGLSEVMKRRRGISVRMAKKFIRALDLTEDESCLFLATVIKDDMRSKPGAEAVSLGPNLTKLDATAFEDICDWKCFAILEIAKLKGFRPTIGWIARKLGTSTTETTLAIDSLVEAGFIQREGTKLKFRDQNNEVQPAYSSFAIQDFHRQVLDKAKAAVSLQSSADRELGASFIAVSKSDLEKIRQETINFRRRIATICDESTDRKDSLYCLGLQLFRLNQEGSND